MPALDQVVQVQITQQTAAVAQPSFGVPLIVGPSNPGWTSEDYVHSYASAAAMLEDGYISSNPEYVWARALMAQDITPTHFLVGRRQVATAQVNTLKVGTLTASHEYSVTIDGTEYSYTSDGDDTQQAILSALLATFDGDTPVTGVVAGTGTDATLTLTAKATADIIVYSAVDASLTLALVTPASSVATDLERIMAQNNTWYGWVLAQANKQTILDAAAWTEGQKKLFLAASNEAAVGTNAEDDVASELKAAGYKRTALLWTVSGIAQGAEAAWLGGQLPQTPGSNNWAYKTLRGITADSLTDGQRLNVVGNPVAGTPGKNANIHTALGGVNVTQMGTTAGGQFIDITVGLDWLQSTIQTYVYAALATAPKKLPYTDAGAAVLIQAVRRAIDEGVDNTLVAEDGISVTAPPVLSVSPNQRAQRIAPDIDFTCRLQGAFNSVTVAGTVTV